jgi:aminopeptidase-like protein
MRAEDKHPFADISFSTFTIWWQMQLADLVILTMMNVILSKCIRRFTYLKVFFPYTYGKDVYLKNIFGFSVTTLTLL